jgi:hypothetical protein
MAIYTVYQKKILNDNGLALENDIVFIKDGVSIIALFSPIIWCFFNKNLFLIPLYLLAILMVSPLDNYLPINISALTIIMIHLIWSFESSEIKRWLYVVRGYCFIKTVSSSDIFNAQWKYINSIGNLEKNNITLDRIKQSDINNIKQTAPIMNLFPFNKY